MRRGLENGFLDVPWWVGSSTDSRSHVHAADPCLLAAGSPDGGKCFTLYAAAARRCGNRSLRERHGERGTGGLCSAGERRRRWLVLRRGARDRPLLCGPREPVPEHPREGGRVPPLRRRRQCARQHGAVVARACRVLSRRQVRKGGRAQNQRKRMAATSNPRGSDGAHRARLWTASPESE